MQSYYTKLQIVLHRVLHKIIMRTTQNYTDELRIVLHKITIVLQLHYTTKCSLVLQPAVSLLCAKKLYIVMTQNAHDKKLPFHV